MSRGSWPVYKKVGGVYTLDGSIYPPNDSLGLTEESTQTKTSMVDGSEAYFSPTIKYLKRPIVFVWMEVDSTYMQKIRDYQRNREDLKIVDINGDTYYGRFTNLDVSWIVGRDEDAYDMRCTFERMPGLEE